MSDYAEFTVAQQREFLKNVLRDVEQKHYSAVFERERSIAIIQAIEQPHGEVTKRVGNKALLSQRATKQRQIRDSYTLDIALYEADMERIKAELAKLPDEDDAADESESGE